MLSSFSEIQKLFEIADLGQEKQQKQNKKQKTKIKQNHPHPIKKATTKRQN